MTSEEDELLLKPITVDNVTWWMTHKGPLYYGLHHEHLENKPSQPCMPLLLHEEDDTEDVKRTIKVYCNEEVEIPDKVLFLVMILMVGDNMK